MVPARATAGNGVDVTGKGHHTLPVVTPRGPVHRGACAAVQRQVYVGQRPEGLDVVIAAGLDRTPPD